MYVGRLLRSLGLEVHKLARGRTDEHSKLRDRLATALAATLVVDAIGTVLMYSLEHGKTDSQITSIWKAFFWVTTQLLTVSSQLRNPVTTGGQVVDILLELWAISVVATVAGAFAAFLQKR
jgi:ABC-type phosphate/phosphonate transport system permease subunit